MITVLIFLEWTIVQINTGILKVHVQYTWVHWIIGIIIKLTIVNTNTCIVTLYFIHGTCSVLEILFKSISNHHWSLRKMKVNRPVYDMEFRQFPCWDGHVQILCLFNCLALFYKHAFAFQPLINFEKRSFKLDSSTDRGQKLWNNSFNFSLSLFYCGFQYRLLPSIQLTGCHFCYQHQLIPIPLDPGLMRSL